MNDLDCHVLDKIHRIQSFQLQGNLYGSWSELDPRLRKSLLRIIQSVTQSIISWIKILISIFIPCINLIELNLDSIESIVDDIGSYEHRYFAHDIVPQLQSLTLECICAVRLPYH